MFPFTDTAPRAARPGVVLTLILINSLIFLWTWSLPPRVLNAVMIDFALIPARYTHPELARSIGLNPNDYWPLLANTFLHGGWLHVISNMWFLWIFGPAMEARFGRIWFAVLYVGGAIVASIVHVITHVDSTEPALGASGAIAAVIAAYALTYPTARVITIIPIVFIPLFVPVPALLFAAIWFGLQLLQGSTELAQPQMAVSVAWWAHIGGFVFGAAFAAFAHVFEPPLQTEITRWTPMRGRRVPDYRPPDWPRM